MHEPTNVLDDAGGTVAIYGIVVFFEADYTNKTIKETGRTKKLPFWQAMDTYAETPNPPSQIYSFTNDEEQAEGEAQLQKNIVDREWLDDLFNQI